MNHPFKKESYQKLSSPDQLDRLLVIIRMPGWIALVVVMFLVLAVLIWSFVGEIPVKARGVGIYFDPEVIELIQADQEGVIEEIFATAGDSVKKDDPLVQLRGSEGEWKVLSPGDGTVVTAEVLKGENVEKGKTLFKFQGIEKDPSQLLVYSFFPKQTGDQIKVGMEALVSFYTVDQEVYGKMKGVVQEIIPFAGTPEGAILKSIPAQQLREYLQKGTTSVTILIDPVNDPKTPSGYAWTRENGPPYPLPFGLVGDVEVYIEEKRPISYLIPIGEKG